MRRAAFYFPHLGFVMMSVVGLAAGQAATGAPKFGSFGGGPADDIAKVRARQPNACCEPIDRRRRRACTGRGS